MTIRWGILGCGDVCEVKSGPAFQQARDSELYAVMRRNGALAEDFARRHGVPVCYSDAERLIADPKVDAVYVASPPGSHLELALKVCAAKKPAYVEKPMARNHSECALMNQAFERAGLPLFVAYYRRSLPRFQKAKAILDSGVLGVKSGVRCAFQEPPRSLRAEALPWRVRADEAGGGLFLDLASHTLDMLDYLLGPLSDVHGVAANVASEYDVEDTVAMSFQSGGIPGTGVWNFASSTNEDLISITGNAGELRISTFGQAPLELRTARGLETFDVPNPPHIQAPLIQSVVDALEGRGVCLSSGVSAARTSAVMDSVLSGYYGSRAQEFWRDPVEWPGFPRARRRR